MPMKCKFKGYECIVEKHEYPNGRLALLLVDENNQPMAKATINISDIPTEENEIFIKDYNENRGMLDALIDAKIIEDTGVDVPIGFTEARLCRYVGE